MQVLTKNPATLFKTKMSKHLIVSILQIEAWQQN